MLQAVMDDIAAVQGCTVVTTLERGLPFSAGSNVRVIEVDGPADEALLFQQLLGRVDAALVIAPETDGVLAERVGQVNAAGVTAWNCSPAAIELCGDKLALAKHLEAHQIPTIATELVDSSGPLPNHLTWPVVLKPRDGAGSCLTMLITNPQEWDHAAKKFREGRAAHKCLCQPYVPGRPLSVGVNCQLDGLRFECLPVGEQHLSKDGRFQYLGGMIPADISDATASTIESLVEATCKTINGLAGYIGFDLLLTSDGHPFVVEINPRLTTSYVGYRQLLEGRLPERWLNLPVQGALPRWKPGRVEFLACSPTSPDS